MGHFVLGYLSRFQPTDLILTGCEIFTKIVSRSRWKINQQAATGDPVACYVLAEIFLSEEIQTVLQPDMKLAADYYDISSEAGYSPAFVQSALIRIHGLKDALTNDKKVLRKALNFYKRESIRNCLPPITTLQLVF